MSSVRTRLPAPRNTMIYVIDDAVTPSIANRIEREIVPNLYFKYISKTTGLPKEVSVYSDEYTYDRGQLVAPIFSDGHKSFPSSDAYPIAEMVLLSCLDKLNMTLDKAKRIKINMLRREDFPEDHYNVPHIDSMQGYSMVYYINDSDGDTILFNERKLYRENSHPSKLTVAKRVTPKKNRAVFFESNRMHASSNPRVTEERYVINFMFDCRNGVQ